MVKIIDGWYYDKDQYQYILYHEYEKDIINIKTRETRRGTVTDTVGYYTSLEAMLSKIAQVMADDKIVTGEVTTIQEHIEALKESYKLIFGGGKNGTDL